MEAEPYGYFLLAAPLCSADLRRSRPPPSGPRLSFVRVPSANGNLVSLRPSLRLLVVVSLSILPSVAHAQGYFAGSKGARVAGRAGAFVAKADDLSAADINPAGFSRMPGWTLQLSNRFSYNSVSYQRDPTVDVAAPGDPTVSFRPVSNQSPLQAVDPLLGASFGIGDWGFALSAFAPPGIARLSFPVDVGMGNTGAADSPYDAGQRYMMVARDAEILTYAASVAYKFKDLFGVGVSAQWVHVPKIEYSMVVDGSLATSAMNPVTSQFDMLSTVSGSDPFTFMAVIGGWVRPVPFLEFALSGQVVPARIQASSHMTVTPLAIEADVNLSRNGAPADDVTLVLPLPMFARFGARYIGKIFDIEVDATYQTWSRVQDFYVATNGLSGNIVGPSIDETIPVTDVVVEKRWKDSFTLQVGSDVEVIEDKLTLRGGLGFESAVADRPYAHVDFAVGDHINAAIGGSMYFGKLEVALAYALRHQLPFHVTEAEGQVYQERPGLDCTNPAMPCPTPPVVNAGSYWATSHFLSLDFLLRLP